MGDTEQLRRSLVEEFGNIYENYGLSRLKGLLVGLVVAHDGPLSLDDMAERLGRSKGPISQTARELALAGLIRKVEGPEVRRDYYDADPDLFLNNFRRNMRTVVKNRTTAEFFLGQLDTLGDGQDGSLREHLTHMRAFYALMEDVYARFEEEWAEAKPTAAPSR